MYVLAFNCPYCRAENLIELHDPEEGGVYDKVLRCKQCRHYWLLEYLMDGDYPELVVIRNGDYWEEECK